MPLPHSAEPAVQAPNAAGDITQTMAKPTPAAAEVDVVTLAELSPAAETQPVHAPPSVLPVMAALPLCAIDEQAGHAELALGSQRLNAIIDASVDRSVMRTALARGERVVVQQEAAGWIVVGALRASATPGVDRGDDYTIEARRVRVKADHEFSVTSGATSFVLRAQGLIETLGENITTRASAAHKLVGRLIRLN